MCPLRQGIEIRCVAPRLPPACPACLHCPSASTVPLSLHLPCPAASSAVPLISCLPRPTSLPCPASLPTPSIVLQATRRRPRRPSPCWRSWPTSAWTTRATAPRCSPLSAPSSPASRAGTRTCSPAWWWTPCCPSCPASRARPPSTWTTSAWRSSSAAPSATPPSSRASSCSASLRAPSAAPRRPRSPSSAAPSRRPPPRRAAR